MPHALLLSIKQMVPAFTLLGLRLAAIGFIFLIQIFLARLLSVEDFGAIQLLLTSVIIASLFLQAGTGKSLVKLIGESDSHIEQRRCAGSVFLGWGLWIAVWLVLGISFIDLRTPSTFIIQGIELPLFLLSSWVIAFSFLIMATSLLRAHFYLKTAILLSDILVPSLVLLWLSYVYETQLEVTVSSLIKTYTIATFIAAFLAVCILIYHRLLGWPQSLEQPFYKALLLLSAPLLLVEIAHLVFNQGAVWLVGIFGDLRTVGLFAIAYRLTDLIVMPSRLITGLIEPKLVQLHKTGNQSDLQQFLRQNAWFITLPGLVLTAIYCLFGKELIQLLFGAEYQTAYPYLCLFAIVRLTGPAFTGYGQSALIMTGHPYTIMKFELLASGLALTTMTGSGLFLGTNALLYSLAAAFLLRHISLVYLCKRATGLRCFVY